jgi:DNA polymerase I-like protein with 3'-5' exonuclease and polymerase domains
MNARQEEKAIRWAAKHRDILRRLQTMDLAEIERRVFAGMGKAAGEAKDIHVASASFFFGVPPEAVTPEQRKAGKAVGYALLYDYRRGHTVQNLADLLEKSYTMAGRKPQEATV